MLDISFCRSMEVDDAVLSQALASLPALQEVRRDRDRTKAQTPATQHNTVPRVRRAASRCPSFLPSAAPPPRRRRRRSSGPAGAAPRQRGGGGLRRQKRSVRALSSSPPLRSSLCWAPQKPDHPLPPPPPAQVRIWGCLRVTEAAAGASRHVAVLGCAQN